MTEKKKRLVAYHEAGHALVSERCDWLGVWLGWLGGAKAAPSVWLPRASTGCCPACPAHCAPSRARQRAAPAARAGPGPAARLCSPALSHNPPSLTSLLF
jgi:hypothetical protein